MIIAATPDRPRPHPPAEQTAVSPSRPAPAAAGDLAALRGYLRANPALPPRPAIPVPARLLRGHRPPTMRLLRGEDAA